MEKSLVALHANQPELLRELQPTQTDVDSARTKYKLPLPAGLPPENAPFLSVSGPLVNHAVEQFGRKLFLALFYKHVAKILPPEGGVAIRWYTNLQVFNDEIPRELATIVPGMPALERNAKPLHDQFRYRYGIAERRAAAFLAFFSQSFAILGYVNVERAGMGLPGSAGTMTPFSPYRESESST